MTIYNEYQVIDGAGGKIFYVGIPMGLIGRKEHQNITDAFLLNLNQEEFHNWMIEQGGIVRGSNKGTGFILYVFEEKKKASKVAKTLTKAYLKYRMAQAK